MVPQSNDSETRPLSQKFVFVKGFSVSVFDNMGMKNEDLKKELAF